MTCTFSYTFDLSPEKHILRYKVGNGEEYLLIHELTWTIYGNSILNITIECNVAKTVLIVAEICSCSGNSKNSALLEDKTAFLNFQNLNFTTPDPWRCIIHAIPHLMLHSLPDSTMASHSLLPVASGPIKRTNLEQLSADMQHIFRTGDLSDVILTDGKTKIPAHKVILSARSPVFARMFQHPMKENCENSVLIPDVPENVLKEFISFIYTGTVAIEDTKMARYLYMAADKYAVIDLKAVCSDVLENVTIDGVLDTLALADLYEDKKMKQSSLEFISNNYAQVKSSKNWESFMTENQPLAIEILSFVIENKI